ncbi:hypothetical protein HanRHA438_Chr14g0677631 [Helianthus annuus]|nr:hypothetical protein HanRHA438_Chr14g0677631 [Helianthus annuus]
MVCKYLSDESNLYIQPAVSVDLVMYLIWMSVLLHASIGFRSVNINLCTKSLKCFMLQLKLDW